METSSDTPHKNAFLHLRNLLDCIRSRARRNALSTAAALLGNIARNTRSCLEWDARAQRFTNSPAANRLLHCQYLEPYKPA